MHARDFINVVLMIFGITCTTFERVIWKVEGGEMGDTTCTTFERAVWEVEDGEMGDTMHR